MLLQKSTDSVRRREADALHLTRFGSVQGRAPSSQLQRTQVRSGGRRNTGTLIEAETSRDRSREWVRPAHGAAGWRWKASWIVVAAALHGAPAGTVSAGSTESRFAQAGRGPRVSDRGVRSTVAPGARGRRNAARKTRSCPLKRIRRLEPPGPPVSLVRGASPGRRGEVQASKRCWERTRRECS